MKVYFKITVFIFILFSVYSCTKNKDVIQLEDNTTLVKKNIELSGFLSDFYSRAYSYHWIKDKDTLDFSINIYERKKDSTSTLSLINVTPMLFDVLIDKTTACIPLIQKDFDFYKINTLYFKSPLYFPDLARDLTLEYEEKFERAVIEKQELDQFLLKSALNTHLSTILKPLHKKAKRYTIEKFDITDKANYQHFLPEINPDEYPEFSLNGTGVYVRLTNLE